MGKCLIIPGADFSENGIIIALQFIVAANTSVTDYYDRVYNAGNSDTWFEIEDANDIVFNHRIFKTGAENVKKLVLNTPNSIITTNEYLDNLLNLEDVKMTVKANTLKQCFFLINKVTKCSIGGIIGASTGISLQSAFQGFGSSESLVPEIDLSGITSVTNMNRAFMNCKAQTIDLSNLTTVLSSIDHAASFMACSVSTIKVTNCSDAVKASLIEVTAKDNKVFLVDNIHSATILSVKSGWRVTQGTIPDDATQWNSNSVYSTGDKVYVGDKTGTAGIDYVDNIYFTKL